MYMYMYVNMYMYMYIYASKGQTLYPCLVSYCNFPNKGQILSLHTYMPYSG